MKIKYNTNNNYGSQAEQLGIQSADEAIECGLAESVGDFVDERAAWIGTEDEQEDDLEGDQIVLIEKEIEQ